MSGGAAGLCVAALLVAASPAAVGVNVLPIYIEDNHAGTFYWLAQRVDLDQPCTLVHFDAHSDASGIFDSDNIRDALRNVASRQVSTNVARSLAQRRALFNASTGSSRLCPPRSHE